jgi:hypothetical protein
VRDVDPQTREVTLEPAPPFDVQSRLDLHPYLRRWDMPPSGDGSAPAGDKGTLGIPITEAAGGGDSGWVRLEQGIEIRFLAPALGEDAHRYRSDDFWTFAARRVLADVLHDNPSGGPQGVDHHFAPLAFVAEDGTMTGLRRVFTPDSAQEE